jgi:hypothetical protein
VCFGACAGGCATTLSTVLRLTVYAQGRARTKPGRRWYVVQVVVHTKDRPAAVSAAVEEEQEVSWS